jgi:cell division protein ZapA
VSTKQLEVQIMGQSYLLGVPEGGEQQLLEAVERVDTAMCRIRDAGRIKARDRIAVLAALNIAADQAERDATPIPASPSAPLVAPTAVSSMPGAASVAVAGEHVGDDVRLNALLARLDAAFSEEGQLL